MADISTEIAAFQNAVYGEEVRGSMISLAEKLNDVCEDTESTVDSFESSITTAISNANTATANANTARDNANAAATAANNAASSAESAADNATSAATEATNTNSAMLTAETARANAESARAEAESERRTAEQGRVSAEQSRVNAENIRTGNESTRQENESQRATAESSRSTAEAARQANETQRQGNETVRQTNESNRQTAFRQIQDAWQDMEQQVLPPATTSTLGGVIVGDGLDVDANGVLSFEGGNFETTEHAAATYATITAVNGKADAQHVHAATDITSGTLAVARGGTGVTTAAAERERLGLGSTTGALPIANGGTGATTAQGARESLNVMACTDQANMGASLSALTSSTQIWGIWANCTNDANTAHNGNRVGMLLYNDGIVMHDGSQQWKLEAKTTTTTTASSIVTAASGVTINEAQYAERNGIASVRVSFKATTAKSGSWTIGTIVSGKRPAIVSYGSLTGSFSPYASINTAGTISVYGTPTADTNYSFGITYILA